MGSLIEFQRQTRFWVFQNENNVIFEQAKRKIIIHWIHVFLIKGYYAMWWVEQQYSLILNTCIHLFIFFISCSVLFFSWPGGGTHMYPHFHSRVFFTESLSETVPRSLFTTLQQERIGKCCRSFPIIGRFFPLRDLIGRKTVIGKWRNQMWDPSQDYPRIMFSVIFQTWYNSWGEIAPIRRWRYHHGWCHSSTHIFRPIRSLLGKKLTKGKTADISRGTPVLTQGYLPIRLKGLSIIWQVSQRWLSDLLGNRFKPLTK